MIPACTCPFYLILLTGICIGVAMTISIAISIAQAGAQPGPGETRED